MKASAPGRRFDTLPILYVLGFVVLASALAYLWRHPAGSTGTQDAGRVNTLQQQVQALAARIQQLEARPAVAPALESRIDALEKRPAPVAQAPVPAVNLGPVEARVAELERRPAPRPVDLGPVESRVTALERRPPTDLGPLGTRIDQLAAKQATDAATFAGMAASLETQLRAANAATAPRLQALDGRVAALEQQGQQLLARVGAAAERAQRVTRLQAAATALEAGQRLGDIPGAPPPLTRFAHDAPPTDAGLRLSFNQAAEAAQRASQPAIMDNQPFASRLWTRAQQAVTVRQGDRVLLGDPIAGPLAHARQLLDAGDLAGAMAVLDGLSGPPAAAMASWLGQARALLEARAALASMLAQN